MPRDWLLRIATERSSRTRGNGHAVAPTLPKDWETLVSRTHEGFSRLPFLVFYFSLSLPAFLQISLTEVIRRPGASRV